MRSEGPKARSEWLQEQDEGSERWVEPPGVPMPGSTGDGGRRDLGIDKGGGMA